MTGAPTNRTGGLLVKPGPEHLEAYCAALRQGWSPDNLRPAAAQEKLDAIARDAFGFLARCDDPEGRGPPAIMPDGTRVPRLPSVRRWIWKDGFCGSIGLRWQKETEALPPTCLGHIGYAVVPWRRCEGLATQALLEILPIAKEVGLRHIDLTADPENRASIRVMEKAGAVLVGSFTTPAALGGARDLLYRIPL